MYRTLLPLVVLAIPYTDYGQLLFLNATQAVFFSTNQTLEAVGNVEARYGVYLLKAQRLEYGRKTGILVAEGNVFLTDNRSVYIKAEKLVYNSTSGVITLYNARGRVKNTFLNAKRVDIKGRLYLFEKVCATKCSDKSAEVCAKKFVYLSDREEGTAYSATLKIEKFPVFYTPYYPITTKRKSGFLTPDVGTDSYGDFIYRQAFFWAIDPFSDATFLGDYRAGGLYGGGIQYRTYFAPNGYFETLNQLYYDEAYPGKWWVGRDYHRKYRYLLSGKGFYGNLSFKWELPSDIDYYYDIFFKESDHYKSFAKSYIQYTVNEKKFELNLKGEYFYNLTTTDRSKDLALLPDLYFYLKPLNLGKGFSTDLTAEITNFYTNANGFWRLRLLPKINWSTALGSVPVTFYIKPYLVYYSSTRYGNKKYVAGYTFAAKGLFYNADLLKGKNWHLSNTWEWTYKFNPKEERNIPPFDYLDEFTRQNLITLRGINSLKYRDREILNLIVEQSYNFYTGYTFPTDGAFIDGKMPPLKLYYTLKPFPRDISFNGQIYYDHKLSKIVYNTVSVNWTAFKNTFTRLNLSFSHTLSKNHLGEKQSEQYSYGVSLTWKNLSVNAKNYYDAIRDKNVNTSLSVNFNRNCWSIGFRYEREYNFDTQKYEWRALAVLSVFSNPFNIILGGGGK